MIKAPYHTRKPLFKTLCLGHFQVGSFRYRSLLEGPYTL